MAKNCVPHQYRRKRRINKDWGGPQILALSINAGPTPVLDYVESTTPNHSHFSVPPKGNIFFFFHDILTYRLREIHYSTASLLPRGKVQSTAHVLLFWTGWHSSFPPSLFIYNLYFAFFFFFLLNYFPF